ncbi:hypothetical protein D0T84_10345 [Dysgonomonas sp. 521]|nr:hypothetical protein [Dysgonomonas sp. 521]
MVTGLSILTKIGNESVKIRLCCIKTSAIIISYVRAIAGLITEKYTVPKDYTKNGIPEDADSGLKEILKELQ